MFANVLLGDEINRAPAKTQSALLEAMQEQQVTIEGETRTLAEPFIVLATQNPIEQEGTYPLPEAQVDRFLIKLKMGYPAAGRREAHAASPTTSRRRRCAPVVGPNDVLEMQALAQERVRRRGARRLRPRRWSRTRAATRASTSGRRRARGSRWSTRRRRSRCCAAATTCCPTTSATSRRWCSAHRILMTPGGRARGRARQQPCRRGARQGRLQDAAARTARGSTAR